MARFGIGDRVIITTDTNGQPLDLIGLKGTIVRENGFMQSGSVQPERTSHTEQLYVIRFDGQNKETERIYESWLEPL